MPINKVLDSEFMYFFRSGDQDAFAKLFKHYYSPLCNYAVTILKYPEIAEEVVQETFIKIWENRKSINIEASVHAYLYRSVHNNCISYFRSQAVSLKHDKTVRDEIALHAEMATHGLTGETLDSIINGELEAFLNQKIDELPEQCNKIFYLSRYEQLTYREIAAKLGISVNTVKTQLSRAFEKLREAYRYFKNK